MTHKFPFARKDVLESDHRKQMLPARPTLTSLGLKEGDRLVDVGCATGYFSFAALDLVGSAGSVLGLDIQQEFVDYARARIPVDHKNIRFELSVENEFPCKTNSADAVLLSVVLHEAESPEAFLAEIRRILVPGGRLMVVEWIPVEMEMGPPLHERIAPESLAALLSANGFAPKKPLTLGQAHYGMTAERTR